MKTFEQLKTSLRDWLGVSTSRLSDTAAGDCINIVQQELCRAYELRYGEFTDTFNTTAGIYDYAVPTGWSKPFSMWYIAPSVGQVIYLNGPLSKDKFDTVYPDVTVRGDVVDYSIWGHYIRLGYTPNSVITITRNYYRVLPDLTDDIANITNNNDFTNGNWQVILFNALVYASRYLVEDSRVAMWEERAKKLTRDLIREDARARSIGNIPQAQEPGTLAPYPWWFNPQATP